MGMESLGGEMWPGRPVVIRSGTSTRVYAIDRYGEMNRWVSLGASWSSRVALTGTLLPPSFPCGLGFSDGSAQVFAIGANGELVRWRTTGSWAPPASPQSLFTGGNGLAAVTLDGQIVHVFAIGTSGIMEFTFNRTSTVTPAGVAIPGTAGLARSVLAAVGSGTTIDVFAIGGPGVGVIPGAPLQWHFNGSTWTRQTFPAGPVLPFNEGNGFTAITTPAGGIELFAITTDQRVTQWSFNATSVITGLHQQLPAGNYPLPQGVPAVARTSTGELDVFAIGPGNLLRGGPLLHWRADEGVWGEQYAYDASLSAGGVGAVAGAAFAYGSGTDTSLQHWPAGIAGATSDRWVNWAGNQMTLPLGHCYPTCLEEVVAIVKTAAQKKREVRAVGSSWSLSDCAATSGYVVETSALDRRISSVVPVALLPVVTSAIAPFADMKPANLVHVEAGIELEKLWGILDAASQAPITMGGASGQTLAGVLSTSVHGSDYLLPPVSDTIRAIHLVGPDGKQYWIEPAKPAANSTVRARRPITVEPTLAWALGPDVTIKYDDAWFDSALVTVGSLGIVYSVVIEVADEYFLEERSARQGWLGGAGVPSVRAQLASGSIFREGWRNVHFAVDPGFMTADPVCFLITRLFQTRAEAEVAASVPPSDPDFLGAFCQCDFVAILYVVGVGFGGFAAAVTAAVSTLVAAMPFLAPFALPLAPAIIATASAVPILVALLKAGPPGTVGDFIGGVLNTLPGLAPAFISAVTSMQMKTGVADGTALGSPIRRAIAHNAMGPKNQGECAFRGDALEIAFDCTNGSYLTFLDSAFAMLRAQSLLGNSLLGWISVRFVGQSNAVLSPQQTGMTCMFEAVGLRTHNMTRPLLGALEALGAASGGIQHWGMFASLAAPAVDAAYPRLDTWLQVRQELTRNGTVTTFDSPFSVRCGLNVPPSWPRTPTPLPTDIGTVVLGSQRSVLFHFPNEGGRLLQVLDVTADGDFRVFPVLGGAAQNLEIQIVTATASNGNEIEVRVTFLAITSGPHVGTLRVHSNAYTPAGGTLEIPLRARVASFGLVTVDPTPGANLDLGVVDVGVTRTVPITLNNAGNINAAVDSFTFSYPGAAAQIAVQTGGITAGQTRTFYLSYTPTEVGPMSTELILHITDGLSPSFNSQDLVIPIVAIGAGALAQLSPATIDFGAVPLGNQSAPTTVLLHNLGWKELTITNWSQDTAFLILGTPPSSVPSGGTAVLQVVFDPGQPGLRAGELAILASNSIPPPASVQLQGTGVAQPMLGATPKSLDFGAVPVGSRSRVLTVVLRNAGGTLVRILAVSLVGPAASHYRLVGPSPSGSTLPLEGTTELRIVLAPTSPGGMLATLEIEHDGPDSPLLVELRGRAIETHELVPSALDLDFGRSAVGVATGKHRLALTNTSPRPARISSVKINGDDPGDFAILEDGCSRSMLGPGDSCVLIVAATPGAIGARTAGLDVTASVKASAVSLRAEGAAVVATWSAAVLEFGNMVIGVQSPRQNAYLHNGGNVPMNITLIDLIGDFPYMDLGPTSMTIAPNQQKYFWVWFKPTVAGSHQAWLRLHSDAPGSPHSLELTGLAF